MDSAQHVQQTLLEGNNPRRKFSVRGVLHRTWGLKHHLDRSQGDNKKHHRHYKYFPALIALLASGSPALADSVGGVSATANPIAQSSSSVQNQAVQILQGPYIQSSVGNGITCQGPTFNLTPFLTYSNSWQLPYEPTYLEPVFDPIDVVGGPPDENGLPTPDGIPDNGWGAIAYEKRVRTGQKDNYSWNAGISATISIPLDGGIQERCKAAMTTQNRIQMQILRNKELDFAIAKLRHCGQLAQEGIRFASTSPFYHVCSDVIVEPKRVQMAPHVHEIEITPSDLGLDEAIDSLNAAPDGAVGQNAEGGFSP